VKRFSRENTNDWGENLNVSVGAMMVLEFKKFIYLCAIKLEDQVREFKKKLLDDLSTDKNLFLTSPYQAPPMI
jgi:hypothetical protein